MLIASSNLNLMNLLLLFIGRINLRSSEHSLQIHSPSRSKERVQIANNDQVWRKVTNAKGLIKKFN